MKGKINVLIFLFFLSIGPVFGQEVLKVAVAGLNHDHVHVLFNLYKQHKVEIVGIAESNTALIQRMQKRYDLPEHLFYPDLTTLLKQVKPVVVLAYNATSEHLQVAEICLPLKIPVMVEKPLAINVTQAKRIAQLAEENKTLFLTNYETTWYKSNQYIKSLVDEGDVGSIKKLMVKDGHEGPKEIGCSADFLDWLTDPEKNGGGALMDFGCYGANLMTWLKKGKKPVAVTAVTKQLKPAVYPRVEDDATIIVSYDDGTTGVIQASWDWPYSVKDFQVFGSNKMLHAVDPNTLVAYKSPTSSTEITLTNKYYENHLEYLADVLSGKIEVGDDLSSLNNNVIVVEILEAAKKSAATGKEIKLM